MVTEDKTIRDESRASSLDAPITSPERPPRVLFETCCIIVAIATATPSDIGPA
jgi:hypothetical protein